MRQWIRRNSDGAGFESGIVRDIGVCVTPENTCDKGERVAVQIDLRNADFWEDVYDGLTARKRSKEPRESLSSVKKRLIKRRKLNG